jgi:CheY-like chemotaxis protein
MFAILEELHAPLSLVVAHPDPDYVAAVSRTFRQLGWDVYPAQTGPAARRLAWNVRAELVVLDIDLPEETGWLTCAKLSEEQPGSCILLIASDLDRADPEFARFVGAAGLYPLSAGVGPLLKHAHEIDPALVS